MEDNKMRQIIKEELAPIAEQVGSLDSRMTKVEIKLENSIEPKIDLILEMLSPLAGKVKAVEEIPAIKDDISLLKASVRFLSDEIQKLKQA